MALIRRILFYIYLAPRLIHKRCGAFFRTKEMTKEEIEKEKRIEEEASAQGKLLSVLRNSGLIISYRGNRYLFRHPFIAAYLASLTLRDASPETLAAKATNPAWSQAIAYASLHTSIEPAVRARLAAPADVLNNHILETSRWLAYAGSNAAWGGALLTRSMISAARTRPAIPNCSRRWQTTSSRTSST